MRCEICGSNVCTRSFHSIAAQEAFDERNEMSSDVQDLKAEKADIRRETIIKCAEIACCAMLRHPDDGTPVLTGEAQSVAKGIAVAIRALAEEE